MRLVQSGIRAALLATATAMTLPAAQAQSVGGVISVTNSTVTGDLTGVGINRSFVTGTTIGNFNRVNVTDGYSSLAGTLPSQSVPFATLGGVIVNGSILNASNITGAAVTGSYLSQSAIGYNNVTANIRYVASEGTITLGNAAATDMGVVSLSNTQLIRGDVTAASINGSAVVETAKGNGNLVNNVDGYTAVTLNVAPNMAARAGSIYFDGSKVGAGNSTAVATDGSTVVQSAAGYGNVITSVRPVTKVTFSLVDPK